MNLRTLQRGIQERQEELHRIATLLGQVARTEGRRAAFSKVATIVLGAFVATNAVATKLWGDNSLVITIVYTVTGLVIAAVSSLEAAFKLESRSGALRTLAARCQSTIWQIDSEWQKSVGWYEEKSIDFHVEEVRLQAARALLDKQDTTLGEVQTKAADLGINVTFVVRQLYDGNPPAMA